MTINHNIQRAAETGLRAKGCKRQSHQDPDTRRAAKTLVIKIVIYDEDIHHDYHHPGLNWWIGVE